jgi:hypothetical protein
MGLRIRRGSDEARANTSLDQGELVWTSSQGTTGANYHQLWVGTGIGTGGVNILETSAGYGLSWDAETQRLEVSGLTTDDISVGLNNKYFTNELAVDAVAAALVAGNATNSNITFVYSNTQDDANRINAIVSLDGIGITDLVDDTTPQLGGNLDLNSNDITGTGNVDITGDIGLAGSIVAEGDTGTLTINGTQLSANTEYVTVGTSASPVGIIVKNTGLIDGLNVISPSTTNNGPNIAFSAVGGSIDAPEVLTVGDSLGQVRFQGYQDTPVGEIQANMVTINAVLAVAGDGASILPRGKLQFLIANGPNPVDAATAEFNKDGVFSAPVMRPGSFTTTQRNALTPAVGMIIYNTTANKFQGYQNTGGSTLEWVDLS